METYGLCIRTYRNGKLEDQLSSYEILENFKLHAKKCLNRLKNITQNAPLRILLDKSTETKWNECKINQKNCNNVKTKLK